MVVVPDNAVQRGPNGLYVYVVAPDLKAELRNIEVGRIEGGQALVENGLSPGERIVTSGSLSRAAGRACPGPRRQTEAAADATPAAGRRSEP